MKKQLNDFVERVMGMLSKVPPTMTELENETKQLENLVHALQEMRPEWDHIERLKREMPTTQKRLEEMKENSSKLDRLAQELEAKRKDIEKEENEGVALMKDAENIWRRNCCRKVQIIERWKKLLPNLKNCRKKAKNSTKKWTQFDANHKSNKNKFIAAKQHF